MHGPLSAQQSHFSHSALTCVPQPGQEWGALLQLMLYVRATTMMLALRERQYNNL